MMSSSRITSPTDNDNTMNPPTNEPQQDGVPQKQSHDDEEQQRSLTIPTTSHPYQPSEDDNIAAPSPKPTPSEPMEHLQSSLEVAIARAHTTVNNQAAQQQNIKEVAVVHIDDSGGKKATKKKAANSDDDNDGKNTKGKYRQRIKKYNNFNIFFMLERQLLLQSRGGGINAVENPIDVSKNAYIKYKPLNLPPLPRRYNHLPLTSNWFLELISNQDKKRQHRKSHGLIPFKELAQTVAKSYREMDDETRQFINEVSQRLGLQYDEYEAREKKERQEALDKLPQPMNATIGHTWAKKRKHGAPMEGKGGKKKKAKSSGEGRKMGGFTFEDHSTAQHLMGMRTSTSPQYTAPHVPSSVTAGFPRIHLAEYETKRHQLEQQLIGRKPTAPAIRPPTVHSMSNMPNLGNLVRMSTAAPHQQRDSRAPEMDESERLKLELLAQAMDARVASELRVQDLTDKVALSRAIKASQQARQPPPAPAALPPISELTPELLKTLPTSTLALLAAGGPALTQALRAPPPPPPPPVAHRTERDNMGSLGSDVTLADIEQTLLKEALLRGIVPPSSSMRGASSAIGGAEDLYSKLAASPARQEAATSSLSSLALSREIDGLARQRALASMRDPSPTRAPPTSSLLGSLIARNRAEQAASRATSLRTQALLDNLTKDRHGLPPQGELDSLLSQLSSRTQSVAAAAAAAATSLSREVTSESPMRRMSDQQLLEIASRNMSSQNMRIINSLRNNAGFAQGKTAE